MSSNLSRRTETGNVSCNLINAKELNVGLVFQVSNSNSEKPKHPNFSIIGCSVVMLKPIFAINLGSVR